MQQLLCTRGRVGTEGTDEGSAAPALEALRLGEGWATSSFFEAAKTSVDRSCVWGPAGVLGCGRG